MYYLFKKRYKKYVFHKQRKVSLSSLSINSYLKSHHSCLAGDVYQINIWWAPCYHWNHRECEFLLYLFWSETLQLDFDMDIAIFCVCFNHNANSHHFSRINICIVLSVSTVLFFSNFCSLQQTSARKSMQGMKWFKSTTRLWWVQKLPMSTL